MSFFNILSDINVKLVAAMNAQNYLDYLSSEGRISFTRMQIQQELELTANATGCLLQRLKQKGQIASPAKGYYLIISPEFRSIGCLPPDFFIDDLMKYLKKNYYVALLSAALYHGAAHQQPQIFQVMLPSIHKPIKCGRVRIQFIKNQTINDNAIIKLKTRTGFMNISTPEVTAKDLLNYIQQSGGIGQIVTVIDELAEKLDANKLKNLAMKSEQVGWIQRLGYILETLDHTDLSEQLLMQIKNRKLRTIPLAPNLEMTGTKRDKKWHIAKNTTIESDIKNDTN